MAEYRLLDFGDGRKLESIGGLVLDRPCPAAEGFARQDLPAWYAADSVFLRGSGRDIWQHRCVWPKDLSVDCDFFEMPVEPTPFGHIGLFPEQRGNWAWIRDFAVRWGQSEVEGRVGRPFRVLNLFAYTGASTMAAACAGRLLAGTISVSEGPVVEVVHVDAAKPNVEAAKGAVALNLLTPVNSTFTGESEEPIPDRQPKMGVVQPPTNICATIRYMVDDARKFVAREIRRKRSYDLIILDPPAYGHGGKRSAWRLERDLWGLLGDCLQLLPSASSSHEMQRSDSGFGRPDFGHSCGMLISGHTEGCGPVEIRRWLRSNAGDNWKEDSGRAGLYDRSGRFLDAGFYMRVLWA